MTTGVGQLGERKLEGFLLYAHCGRVGAIPIIEESTDYRVMTCFFSSVFSEFLATLPIKSDTVTSLTMLLKKCKCMLDLVVTEVFSYHRQHFGLCS